jgi:glycosyltransferase involved in cell wall biosynthesis
MKQPRLNSLSVFFPCYNEEENVERTVKAALESVPLIADDYELIIVDDGSSDRTGEIADRLAREYPQIRAVHNRPNLGYGGALQQGFRAATKDYVFYTDGDGQFDIAEIVKLLPLLDRYDIVSAYRLDRRDSLIRRFNGWGWTVLVDIVFGLRLRDIDCAFKIFPRRLFDEIEMCSMGALIDAEVLARARYRGYRIGQVGVHHLPRKAGIQTGADLRVILRAFTELFRLYWRIKREERGA